MPPRIPGPEPGLPPVAAQRHSCPSPGPFRLWAFGGAAVLESLCFLPPTVSLEWGGSPKCCPVTSMWSPHPRASH